MIAVTCKQKPAPVFLWLEKRHPPLVWEYKHHHSYPSLANRTKSEHIRRGQIFYNKQMQRIKSGYLPGFNTYTFSSLSQKPTLFTLKQVIKAYDMKWSLVETQVIPDNFISRWLWDVFSWIQAAIKKYEKNPHLKNMSFNEILSGYDPGLDIVARHTVRQLIELETKQDDVRLYLWSRFILAWLYYMAAEVGITFNFLDWSKTAPTLDQFRLEETLSRDPHEDHSHLVKTNKLLAAYYSNSQPEKIFRSRSLWALLNRIWIGAEDNIFHSNFLIKQDFLLATSILPIFLEVFGSTLLELVEDEIILFELWTDKVLRYKRIKFNWRKVLRNFHNENPDFFQTDSDNTPESSDDQPPSIGSRAVKKYPSQSYPRGCDI
ncbi:hypothetical protein [Endozoicomonas sp. Mp262]|uniref:hypothetical protein n=1 Tax=Endozoicomonas sp. Mp262 TaxID=2919499 RepID=UPI0021DB6BB1